MRRTFAPLALLLAAACADARSTTLAAPAARLDTLAGFRLAMGYFAAHDSAAAQGLRLRCEDAFGALLASGLEPERIHPRYRETTFCGAEQDGREVGVSLTFYRGALSHIEEQVDPAWRSIPAEQLAERLERRFGPASGFHTDPEGARVIAWRSVSPAALLRVTCSPAGTGRGCKLEAQLYTPAGLDSALADFTPYPHRR